jgi:hypothetical protein
MCRPPSHCRLSNHWSEVRPDAVQLPVVSSRSSRVEPSEDPIEVKLEKAKRDQRQTRRMVSAFFNLLLLFC